MPWTCPTCKHVFDVGPSVPITPPEAHAEAGEACSEPKGSSPGGPDHPFPGNGPQQDGRPFEARDFREELEKWKQHRWFWEVIEELMSARPSPDANTDGMRERVVKSALRYWAEQDDERIDEAYEELMDAASDLASSAYVLHPPEPPKGGTGALYMVKLLKAASHTLRSYEFGNSDPSSAKHMADQIDAALREGEKK